MSCRHDLANGTCTRCYPDNPFGRSESDRIDPGDESDYGPNLDGPGAVVVETAPALDRASVAIKIYSKDGALASVVAVDVPPRLILVIVGDGGDG